MKRLNIIISQVIVVGLLHTIAMLMLLLSVWLLLCNLVLLQNRLTRLHLQLLLLLLLLLLL